MGALAPRSSAPEFAGAIEALFARDLAFLKRAARHRACQRHGWDAVFQRLTEIYAEVGGEPAFARAPASLALAS